jgi:hypothetical protein
MTEHQHQHGGEPNSALPTAEESHRPAPRSSSHASSTVDRARRSPSTARKEAWWKMHLFRGMYNDLRRRGPYYAKDWADAWDYRVVPATVYMYFAKYVFPSYLWNPSRDSKFENGVPCC